MNEETKTVPASGAKQLAITVTYDTNPYKQVMKADWGFATLITGTEKTILFDTGGRYFFNIMRRLRIDPNSIEVVVLSHIHGEHIHELSVFLQQNPNVTVYLPESVPEKLKDNARNYGATIVGVKGALQICEDVYSTGQLGTVIKEHSLILRTDKGLVVITGCAHPGIVNVLNTAKELMQDDILLVMGGFHDENYPLPLEWATKDRIIEIISEFKQLGVRYVGPCHCAGEHVRSLFKRYFGRKYISVSTGKIVTLTDL